MSDAKTVVFLHARVEHNMTNHPPANPDVVEAFERLREAAKDLAHLVVDIVPASREQSLALTEIEQALMWAVAGVARNQDDVDAFSGPQTTRCSLVWNRDAVVVRGRIFVPAQPTMDPAQYTALLADVRSSMPGTLA